jgi:hypothetical protein
MFIHKPLDVIKISIKVVFSLLISVGTLFFLLMSSASELNDAPSPNVRINNLESLTHVDFATLIVSNSSPEILILPKLEINPEGKFSSESYQLSIWIEHVDYSIRGDKKPAKFVILKPGEAMIAKINIIDAIRKEYSDIKKVEGLAHIQFILYVNPWALPFRLFYKGWAGKASTPTKSLKIYIEPSEPKGSRGPNNRE